jgi:hypothetical protein
MRSLKSCTARQTNEMGGTGSTYGGQGKCRQRFGRGNLKEGDHLEDLNVDGKQN